jgi:vitamin B12 transporter
MKRNHWLKPKNLGLVLAILTNLSSSTALGQATATSKTTEPLPEFNLAGMTVEAKRPDWESKLSPGTVTVVRPDDYKGEQKSLPDLLKEVPGVHVREVNGKGQYTTVTVRGSTAAQVGVFIDGVLSNLGGDAAVDISTIPVKNVERIEVYRGYIPARFGGTFMGGVINVVTKKPTKTGVSVEVGKSSYNGKRASMELSAPLGSGSLLLGANYESSDGDFKYSNYAAERILPNAQQEASGWQSSLDNFNIDNIDILTKSTISLTDAQKNAFKNNQGAWLNYVRSKDNTNSLRAAIVDNAYGKARTDTWDSINHLAYLVATDNSIKQQYLDQGYGPSIKDGDNYWMTEAGQDWARNGYLDGIMTPAVKEKFIKLYAKDLSAKNINTILGPKGWADPETSTEYKVYKEKLAATLKKIKGLKDNTRYRRYNDYSNSSVLAKWQNKDWMAKLSWNKIDRHLPDTLWGDSANDAMGSALTDLQDIYYAESRHQKLTNTEALLEKRHQNGKLEWGWRLDYLHQNKDYKTENMYEPDNFRWTQVPLRAWSNYTSNKYNGQVDGTYKLNNRQMLDFQANYSHERLDVDGSLMDKVLGDDVIGNLLGQTRNRYDQNILNLQLQDTITLDPKGTWYLTPAVRYNQSKIIGYSDGKRFGVNQKSKFHWLHPEDSQTDGKATWQLALKKQFNDSFTMRMTGGTYYRLLNMYEIAGDGAGMLPASRDGTDSVFPLPEEGKQFDISALWNGKILGANNNTTITYFWRDSDNMLQLVRAGLDYWSYFNDNKGKAHGWELQSNFKWKKFDLDLKGTQTLMSVQRKNSVVDHDYSDVWPTYQPEWEANARLTYHPTDKWSIFGEMHYTDEYFTMYSRDSSNSQLDYLAGKPVSSLTVYNAGLKWQPRKSWQVVLGCNDIFNKGPEQRVRSNTAFYEPGDINVEFPLQGRTYYATVKYTF